MSESYSNQERPEVAKVRAAFPSALKAVLEERGDTFLCVDRAAIVDVVKLLKEDPELDYGYFVECLGVDYSTWQRPRWTDDRFEVVYNLYSLTQSARIFVKVGVDDGQTVPTLKHVFIGAEYPERETWDMLGIVFEGNEQKQRFLLPDDWVGFPLRKDFPLGGEDVLFDRGEHGPAIEDIAMPHAGESFTGKTGTDEVSGR